MTGMDEIDKLAVSYGWEARMKASIKKKTYNLEVQESLDRLLREGRFRTIYR